MSIMSNNEYGDGGINWCDIPFPDARSIANQSPEIIDNAVRRDATVMATRGHTSHMENELRAEVRKTMTVHFKSFTQIDSRSS